jgi:hypothetical protein
MDIACNTKTRLNDLTASNSKMALANFQNGRHHWKQNESASLRAATNAASSGRRPLDNPPATTRSLTAWRQRGGAYISRTKDSRWPAWRQRAARRAHLTADSGFRLYATGSGYTKSTADVSAIDRARSTTPSPYKEGQHCGPLLPRLAANARAIVTWQLP